MNCRLDTPLLNAYLDGELAATEAERVSDHLATCAGCAQQTADLKTLQLALGSEAFYHHASGKLRSRVAQTLAAGSSASVFTQPVTTKTVMMVFVSIALFAGAVWLGWKWMNRLKPTLPQPTLCRPRVLELSLRSHEEATTQHRQTELASSDSQAVKQWL
ncbi:MAG TPA: anti-sigma factor [Gemmatales bacterium]|nr:anti-sigma factor [Gemmatales bacterium]